MMLVPALLLAAAAYQAELIIPPEKWHNHSSSVVELPDGSLLVCWYHGSGEREADDVKIEAARLPRGARAWQPRFTLADTPGFPDANPVLFLDAARRLWLLWPVILANRWETALMEYKIASDYRGPGPPRWSVSEPMLFIPRNFEPAVKAAAQPLLETAQGALRQAIERVVARAGDKYAARMGWMPRVHPLQLPSGRILVPLYSDGYDFSLIAITDDGGATWTTSEPLVSEGGVQPSLVRRRDGTLRAYMRDNGPPPKRVLTATSRDDGVTWSRVTDTDIPNPGSSLEVIGLRDGSWLMVYNDTEKGRASLVAALSDDEGATWKWKRDLERGAGSFHYPSVIQARDGSIHVTYSFYTKEGQSIKHVRFPVEWVRE